MNPPTVATANINPLSMLVTWTPISNFLLSGGRDPPIYYGLEWDQGKDDWQLLTTP
jgi:hypothetical protein